MVIEQAAEKFFFHRLLKTVQMQGGTRKAE
jgi:hypothetical protein